MKHRRTWADYHQVNMWLQKVSDWASGKDGLHGFPNGRRYSRQLYLAGTRRILTVQRWAEDDAYVQAALRALQANDPSILTQAGGMGTAERAHQWPSIWGRDG